MKASFVTERVQYFVHHTPSDLTAKEVSLCCLSGAISVIKQTREVMLQIPMKRSKLSILHALRLSALN
jgi:hypothetical protein